MDFERLPLIVTDGFDFYEKVVRRVFGPAALYDQVLKTRRNDRIVKVERRELMGASWRFEEALNNSEDSSTLNTSFIERMNLTIRQGSAYLSRRTLSHARSEEKLEQHLELLRCHYNFVRPHGALKFGRETRTPAMLAGLATRRLTFREVFVCLPPSLISRHRRDHVRRRCHYNFVRPHGALKFGRETRTPAMLAGLATRRLTFREVFVCLPPSLISRHRRDHVRRAEPAADRPDRGRASGGLSNS